MNPEISICIPVLSGTYIQEVLNSVFNNKFQDFEVVVNDASSSTEVQDILKAYDVRVIEKVTKSLESRMVTVSSATGDRVFLMDETRILGDTILGEIAMTRDDMLVIKEKDVGGGLLNYLSNLDKKYTPENAECLDPIKNKSIIPRVYRKQIIVEAFGRISKNLPSEIITKIEGMDLELIYLESFSLSRNVGIIKAPSILHYGDTNFRSLFRKYYRYGRSQRILRNTPYRDLASLSGRNRTTLPFGNRLQSVPIQLIRGIPFIFGYLTG